MVCNRDFGIVPNNLLIERYRELVGIQQQHENQLECVISERLLLQDELEKRGLKHG
jgi:hypothetical protein